MITFGMVLTWLVGIALTGAVLWAFPGEISIPAEAVSPPMPDTSRTITSTEPVPTEPRTTQPESADPDSPELITPADRSASATPNLAEEEEPQPGQASSPPIPPAPSPSSPSKPEGPLAPPSW